MHSSSIAAYHCCVGVTELEPHWISASPCSCSCTSAKPMPCKLDALVRSIAKFSGLNGFTVFSSVRISFIMSKFFWCSSIYVHATPLHNKGLMPLVWCAKLGMKDPSWLARPRNACRTLMHVGVGKFRIVVYFVGSGLMPPVR